uniref:Uncharacterized protein n=1 Tax=Euplotes harpa TaxID=151035 RepID=A0A7S3N3L6_9SPIT|mmetsp:Transcript_17350/g.20130  ORF Transcript_17350/g.20130 Transcript_17350/m.20130 type:complete len:196 (+) Transcript_17350:337-924(+)
MNDEIIAQNYADDNETSSVSSYTMDPRGVRARPVKRDRSQNARKFLDKLKKARDEVVAKRIANPNKHILRAKQSVKASICEKKCEVDSSTDPNSSLFTIKQNEARNLKEKFFKEKQMQKLMNKTKPEFKPCYLNPVAKPKKRKTNKQFEINYEDLDRKDNFIFFEVLATYADAYLKDEERDAKNLERFVVRKKMR